jgi:hypothetical protein
MNIAYKGIRQFAIRRTNGWLSTRLADALADANDRKGAS